MQFCARPDWYSTPSRRRTRATSNSGSRLEAIGVTMLPQSWQNPAESCDGVDAEGNVLQIAVK